MSCVRPTANDGTAGVVHRVHGLGEDVESLRFGLVLAPAVRRLDEHVVRVHKKRGVAKDRRAPAPEVA